MTTLWPVVVCLSACLLIANAVHFHSVLSTIFLAIVLAKFLFPFDSRRVIPPRNNALALRRGGHRPLDGPLLFTGPTGAAGVSALNLVPNWSEKSRNSLLSLILK